MYSLLNIGSEEVWKAKTALALKCAVFQIPLNWWIQNCYAYTTFICLELKCILLILMLVIFKLRLQICFRESLTFSVWDCVRIMHLFWILQIAIMTLTLFPIRLFFAAFMMLLAWPFAFIASMGSDEQDLEKPLSWWRKWVTDMVEYWENHYLIQQFEIEKIANTWCLSHRPAFLFKRQI